MPSWPFEADLHMTPAAASLHPAENGAADTLTDEIDLTILVSCYNEQSLIVRTIENVLSALDEVGGIRYEILVIDDCSTDDSTRVIEEFIGSHPDEPILLRKNRVNRGLAQNYIDGAFLGRGKYYRLVCGDDAEPKDS